ncbi:MAG: hypothetical protein AAGH41_08995 [Pseudomonadota bacterium]
MPIKTKTNEEITQAILSSKTKREAAERLSLHAGSLNARCLAIGPVTLEAWRSLPAGGAFADRFASIPKAYARQDEVDAMVAEAAGDYPPSADRRQVENVVRLIFGMYAVTGTMNLPRGWVRALIQTLRRAGCRAPTPSAARWYRSRIADDPASFARFCPDPELLDDLLAA